MATGEAIGGTGPEGTRTYWSAGLRIRSDLPLAARVVEGPADAAVVAGGVRDVPWERPSTEVIAERVVDGIPWYTFARRGRGTVARFYGLADFEIDADGRRLVYHRDPAADPELLAILVAGTLTAYLLSTAGTLVLHASAVQTATGALAFAGPSGQGKTTIATLLCAEGFPLVSDDLLPVTPEADGVWCVPSGIELRVREKAGELVERFGAATARRRTVDERSAVAARTTTAERLPLRAVVVPWPDRQSDRVRARPLGAGEAAFTLARFQRVEGWTGSEERRRQFDTVAALVAAVPVLEVHVPWGPPFPEALGGELLAVLDAG